MAIKKGDRLIYTDDRKREWKVEAVGKEDQGMVAIKGGPFSGDQVVPVDKVHLDEDQDRT